MPSLGLLERRARVRLALLTQLAARMPTLESREADRLGAVICIEAHNLWGEFARNYLAAAVRRTRTVSGRRVSTRFPRGTSLETALKAMPAVLRRVPRGKMTRFDEPPWHTRRTIIKVAREAGLSNLAQVQSALSLPSRVIDDLPGLRHFFAHRNEETAVSVRRLPARYAMVHMRHPTTFLRSYAPGRPTTVLEDWLAELSNVVAAMCA